MPGGFLFYLNHAEMLVKQSKYFYLQVVLGYGCHMAGRSARLTYIFRINNIKQHSLSFYILLGTSRE